LTFVEVKERGFTLIEIGILPVLTAEIPGVIPCHVVVAPIVLVL
jgi:hypothetical protein